MNQPAIPSDPHSTPMAGAAPWCMELKPWDFWKQTDDPARDGDVGSGNNALNDCGPECLSMCVAHLSDVVLDADYIKDCIRGPAYVGYTSLADLQLFLRRYVRTDSLIVYPASKQEWLYQIWKSLTLQHPVIGLFSFSAPGAADGHFRCAVGMSSARRVVTADPATGTRREEDWDKLFLWAKGPLLRVHRKRAVEV